MYSRSYKDGEISSLPPHYDGVAFGELTPEVKAAEESEAVPTAALDGGIFSRFLGTDLFARLKMPKIGTEEILLIAAALFLFFSADGDKECAILILILVFLA